MILVDTSIWVQHLRTGHATMTQLLECGHILGHPWVVGELALGRLSRRTRRSDASQPPPHGWGARPARVQSTPA